MSLHECTRIQVLVTAKPADHNESKPKLEAMNPLFSFKRQLLSSSRTNGIQYSVLETHNTTWQTTVTVVEHHGNSFYITTDYFCLTVHCATLLISYMYYYLCFTLQCVSRLASINKLAGNLKCLFLRHAIT